MIDEKKRAEMKARAAAFRASMEFRGIQQMMRSLANLPQMDRTEALANLANSVARQENAISGLMHSVANTITRFAAPEPERFCFSVVSDTGTFRLAAAHSTDEAIPYNWNVYVDGELAGHCTGVSGGTGTVAETLTLPADGQPHRVCVEPAQSPAPAGWLAALGNIGNPDAYMVTFCNSVITPRMIGNPETGVIGNLALDNLFRGCANLTLGAPFGFSAGCDVFTNAGTFFCASMFNGCTGLARLPDTFSMPQGLAAVGESFARSMFYGCTSLADPGTAFNLPQKIKTIGANFAYSMFYGCASLAALPAGFNLPQGITDAKNLFAYYMFANCASLTSLPDGFTLPLNLTRIGTYFACSMFIYCLALTALPDSFAFPQSTALTTVGDGFCVSMLQNDPLLQTLPPGFTPPQHLTSVGYAFMQSMLEYDTALAALPDAFQIPQGIVTCGYQFLLRLFSNDAALSDLPQGFNLPPGMSGIGNSFCGRMFASCTSLTALPDGFNLPQGIQDAGDNFASYMFSGCTALQSLPASFNLPSALTTVGSLFCYYMFYNCSGLATLPAAFNLPQRPPLASAGVDFATYMFSGCKILVFNSAFQLTDVWAIQVPAPDSGAFRAYYYAFSGITAPQTRTAAGIIGSVPTPADDTNAFAGDVGFSDYDSLDPNWR